MGDKMEYPKHKHPHGINDITPKKERIWVCEECFCAFKDDTIRKDLKKRLCGHICHKDGRYSRCESHLEPYTPDILEG